MLTVPTERVKKLPSVEAEENVRVRSRTPEPAAMFVAAVPPTTIPVLLPAAVVPAAVAFEDSVRSIVTPPAALPSTLTTM